MRAGEGRRDVDDEPTAMENTETGVKRSHSSSLQSDSVWLGVTSQGCFMSQAGDQASVCPPLDGARGKVKKG